MQLVTKRAYEAAAQEFADAPLQQPLILLATADEESSMAGAMALVDMGRPVARYAVIGEPTGMRPVYQHKSILMESIEVVGQAGHSSNPELGSSALEAMQDVINELLLFREHLQNQFSNPQFEVRVPTLNLGCIHGGDNPNRMQMHFQLQVILKPDPGNPQETYIKSLEAIGIDPREHDIRFVEDNWEQPAIGAWGLGWEV